MVSRAGDEVPDLCRPFLDSLPITGVSIAVISDSGAETTLCSTDSVAARMDELQFELGEGPQWEAARSGEIVEITDVQSGASTRWPILAESLIGLAVGSVFAIPMRMGAVTIGVASLYRDTAGRLSEDEKGSALAIASAVASTAVLRAMASASADASPESPSAPALRREVHQATGIVLVQLNATATVAYARLQAYAYATGRTLQAVAHDVVTNKLIFEENPL